MKNTGSTEKGRSLLRTHLWLVLLATFVAVGAALAAAAAKPVTYTATALVLVSSPRTASTPLLPDMGTEAAIAQSGVVVDRGAAELGIDGTTVRQSLSVTPVINTRVLKISYSASTAVAAYRGASVLATSYVDYRNRRGSSHSATLVTDPVVPSTGSRGSLLIYLMLGLVGGLTVGIAAAWLWDRFSDRLRSAAELRRLTGLPILAMLRPWDSSRHRLPPAGPAREAFAFVAARLAPVIGHDAGTTIVVTSPRTGAGTTSVACGTAVALATQGKRVVLVAASSAGLRAEEVLGVPTSPGLGQLLTGPYPLELARHPTDVRNLSVIPTGDRPEAGLALEDLRRVLEQLETAAYVVIDAPPLLSSADSLLLADVADHVVLVGDLRTGTRADVAEAQTLLGEAGPTTAGWVVNLPPRQRRRSLRSRLSRASAPEDPAPEPPDPEFSAPKSTAPESSAPEPAAPEPSPPEPVTPEVLSPVDEVRPVTPPAAPEPEPISPAAARPAPPAMKAPPRPDTPLPVAPTTGTPARDVVRLLRAPYAAARRR